VLNPTLDEKRVILCLENDLDRRSSPLDPSTKLFAIYAPVQKTIVVRHLMDRDFRRTELKIKSTA